MKTFLATVIFGCIATVSAHAQTAAPSTSAPAAGAQAAAPVKDPVSTGLRLLQPRFQKNTIGAIESMPADKFNYKPTPDQITFAHLAAHIADSNYSLCAKFANVTAPKVDAVTDTDPKDKLLAAVKASFDYCTETLAKADDSHLGDTVDFFGRFQGPRAVAALILSGGWADHYAAAAMYLRLNNILPPSAQPKK